MQQNNKALIERRSCLRIKADVRVYYDALQSKLLSSYSVDFSTGGVYLTTDYPFDVDDHITVKFSLPGQDVDCVSCKARVAWVNNEINRCKPEYPLGVGLQFINLAPEDLHSITGFLEVEATS